jgi:hypothetical protein
MPTYTFKNVKTGKISDHTMSISDHDGFLASNPDLQQVLTSTAIISGVSAGRNKPSAGFREVLKNIKKANRRSTVNTFD